MRFEKWQALGNDYAIVETRGVVRLQTGYVYHYAFAMLIGVAALMTWYLASGGAH